MKTLQALQTMRSFKPMGVAKPMGAAKPLGAFMKPTPTGITSAEAVDTKKAVNMNMASNH